MKDSKIVLSSVSFYTYIITVYIIGKDIYTESIIVSSLHKNIEEDIREIAEDFIKSCCSTLGIRDTYNHSILGIPLGTRKTEKSFNIKYLGNIIHGNY